MGVFPSKQMDELFRYKRVKVIVGLLDQGEGDHRKGEKNAKGKLT